jgi:hypothetical protein
MEKVQDYQKNILNSSIYNFSQQSIGDELIKYANHYYVGFATVFLGSGIALKGTIIQSDFNVTVGSIIILIGALIQAESHTHIRQAGILLNQQSALSKNRFKIKSNSNGLSLVYNFK